MNAQLHIRVAKKDDRSFLKHSFFTTPFKVMDITENRSSGELQLMLMSSSPGILDGDTYDLKIEIEKNCSLQLHTQAYQRLFNMRLGAAQQINVHLEENASFIYLPHPSVPHEQSIFTSSNKFYLRDNCTLLFGEILTCGRKLNGEAFLFSKYHSISNVYVNNKLTIKENLLMQPAEIDVTVIGQLEGYTHQASLIYLQPHVDVKELRRELLELLDQEKDIDYGISIAPVNGLVIRLLGNGAEHLYDLLKNFYLVITRSQNAGTKI